MSTTPNTQASPELVQLLDVLAVLFPQHYPVTTEWLAKSGMVRSPKSASVGAASDVQPSGSEAQESPPKKAPRRTRSKSQKRTEAPPRDGSRRPRPKRRTVRPAAPAGPVWPPAPKGTHRRHDPVSPPDWAQSHNLGCHIDWHEEQRLKTAFAARLDFPANLAGTMGTLIQFRDGWPAAGGETRIAVYHPRDRSGLALVDVIRDDQLMAQFEAPLQNVDGGFVESLLPTEWRRRS